MVLCGMRRSRATFGIALTICALAAPGVSARDIAPLDKPPAKATRAKAPTGKPSKAFMGFAYEDLVYRFGRAFVRSHLMPPDPAFFTVLRGIESDLGLELDVEEQVTERGVAERLLAGFPAPNRNGVSAMPAEVQSLLIDIAKVDTPSAGNRPFAVQAFPVYCTDAETALNARVAKGVVAAKWTAEERTRILRVLTIARDNGCLASADYKPLAKGEAERLAAALPSLQPGKLAMAIFDLMHGGYVDLVPPAQVQRLAAAQDVSGAFKNSGELTGDSAAALAGAYVFGYLLHAGGERITQRQINHFAMQFGAASAPPGAVAVP